MQVVPVLGDRYRLGPVVGTGGMGAVHRAYDERLRREVAIKVVRSGAGEVDRERLRREAQYLARLDHPNLVAVLDAGADGDVVWFAMELVHGADLGAVLARSGPLGGEDARRVLAALLGALGVLHEAGLVHRDVKPGNVLLAGEDVKLVDLGIAQHARAGGLTTTGNVIGTVAYLSPEQVEGAPVGPATDVYALGLLILEALTGRTPFPGGPAETAAARLVRAPALPAGLDPAWAAVLAAMTALRPADRPSPARLLPLVRDLPTVAVHADVPTVPLAAVTAVLPRGGTAVGAPTAVLPTRPPAARPAARSSRVRQRALTAVCALLVLVGAGGGWALLAGASGPPANADPKVTAAPSASHRAAAPRTTGPPSPTPVAAHPSAAPPATTAPEVDRQSVRQSVRQQSVHDRVQRAEQILRRLTDRFRHRGDHHRHHR